MFPRHHRRLPDSHEVDRSFDSLSSLCLILFLSASVAAKSTCRRPFPEPRRKYRAPPARTPARYGHLFLPAEGLSPADLRTLRRWRLSYRARHRGRVRNCSSRESLADRRSRRRPPDIGFFSTVRWRWFSAITPSGSELPDNRRICRDLNFWATPRRRRRL